jgi:Fe(3+) dicitrate transport protein
VLNKNAVLTTILYGNQYTRDWWRENDKFVKPDGSAVTAGYEGPVVRVGSGKNVGRLREFKMAGIEPRLKVFHNLLGIKNTFELGTRVHAESFRNKEIKGDTSFSRSGTIDRDEFFTAYAFSGYAANKFTLGRLNVSPGVRMEFFKQKYNRYYDPVKMRSVDSAAENNTLVLLPGVSINYLTDKINLYSGVHRGFTPPTVGTAFLNAAQVYEVAPGEDNLDAEKSWNTEAGLKYNLDDRAQVEAAYFRMDIINMVDAGRDAVFKNLGKVRYQGIESAFSLNAAKLFARAKFDVVLNGNYTFLNGKIIDAVVIERPVATSSGKDTINVSGNITPYSPVHTLQLGIEAAFPFNLSLRFDYKFVSEQFTDFANTVEESEDGTVGILPPYNFMNFSARYGLPRLGLTFHFAVKNIANKIYRGSRVNRTSSGIFPDGFRQIITGIEWNY